MSRFHELKAQLAIVLSPLKTSRQEMRAIMRELSANQGMAATASQTGRAAAEQTITSSLRRRTCSTSATAGSCNICDSGAMAAINPIVVCEAPASTANPVSTAPPVRQAISCEAMPSQRSQRRPREISSSSRLVLGVRIAIAIDCDLPGVKTHIESERLLH